MNVSCSAGTASVIIALTDGELNEWQFDTAQREVRWVRGLEGLGKILRTLNDERLNSVPVC